MLETFQEVKILVFTDEEVWKACFHELGGSCFSVLILDDTAGAFADVLLFRPQLICLSYSFLIKAGLSFPENLIRNAGGIPVVLLSDEDDLTVSAWIQERGGCVISARPDPLFIKRKLEAALGKAPVTLQNSSETPDLSMFDTFIGETEKMHDLKRNAARYAKSGLPVLITGGTGTGKTYLANAIHNASSRASKPFRSDSMAEIQDTLAERILFGSVRHAYTDADNSTGLFEAANGGTVFLDEIGEASPVLQAKLLRVLGQQKIQKVGATSEIPVDVRIITATNRNLIYEVEEGRFRQDLYYRIAVLPLEIPPLCERLDDIPLLINYFLKDSTIRISRGAMERLLSHSWPGNVRELELCLEATVLTSGCTYITESDIVFPQPAIPRNQYLH